MSRGCRSFGGAPAVQTRAAGVPSPPRLRGQKALLVSLKKIDLEEWKLATEDTARASYSRLAAFMASTPWPMIKRRGVYGLACQEAISKNGKRTTRGWKPEEEI